VAVCCRVAGHFGSPGRRVAGWLTPTGELPAAHGAGGRVALRTTATRRTTPLEQWIEP